MQQKKKHIFRKLPCAYNTVLTGQIVPWQCGGKFIEDLLVASPVQLMLCGLSVCFTKQRRRLCDFICVSGFILDLILSERVAMLLPG